jgi:hypothetical protein
MVATFRACLTCRQAPVWIAEHRDHAVAPGVGWILVSQHGERPEPWPVARSDGYFVALVDGVSVAVDVDVRRHLVYVDPLVADSALSHCERHGHLPYGVVTL